MASKNIDEFLEKWLKDSDNTTMRASGGDWTDASVKGFAENYTEQLQSGIEDLKFSLLNKETRLEHFEYLAYHKGYMEGFNKGSEAGVKLATTVMNMLPPKKIFVKTPPQGPEGQGSERTSKTEAPEERPYDTGPWVHSCGNPSCSGSAACTGTWPERCDSQ